MSEWQKCPICEGSGIDRFATASTSIPNRISHPCHGCSGKGMITTPLFSGEDTLKILRPERTDDD